jgi:hypothetical protein
MTRKRHRVAGIMGRVMDRVRTGEPDPDHEQSAEQGHQQQGPSGGKALRRCKRTP